MGTPETSLAHRTSPTEHRSPPHNDCHHQPHIADVIITIDGPSGSGKSTTARAVARALGYLYLDTGAMYRAVALAFLRADADATPEAAAELLPGMRIDVRYEDGEMRVLLDRDDVTASIRSQEVGTMASRVSKLPIVREKLVREQRRIAREREQREGGIVLDGRDTGTVVFPDADLKIYMRADAEVRARRRQAEYAERGRSVAFEAVYREIVERDEQDRSRSLAPLRKADDAVELDTTHRTVEEQVEFVVKRAEAARREGTNP